MDYADECKRCGTCCRKGGPALHQADRELVRDGHLPLRHLITIREGEPAWDNVADRIEPAPSDIIKIAAKADNDPTCVFFDTDETCCTIYAHRPLECRLLACWDTAAMEAAYRRERLTRSDLLVEVEGLGELVRDHQERCGYERIAALVEMLNSSWNPATVAALLGIVRYDLSLRQVTLEKSHLDEGILLFLFGRPLAETIRRFKLKIVRNSDGWTIERS